MINKEVHKPRKTTPRFFYGYIVVIASFIIMVVTWGLYNVFGVFFKPLLTEFNWTSAMTSGAFSLSMFLHGVLGMVMGGLADRFGPRVVVTFCGFILGLGYLLTSQVGALWQLYLFYGVVVGIGMSGIWVPLLSSVARWFVRRRSQMTGIVIAGAGIGAFIAPMVISRLIAAYDWRLAYIILGSLVLVFMVSVSQFLRRDPARMGQLPYGENEGKQQGLTSEDSGFSLKEAVYTPQFWIFFVVLFCFGFCMFSVIVHIVRHAIELKISPITAANILAISGAASILGNFVMGAAGDRIGNRKVFIIGFVLMSAVSFWLVWAGEVWALYLCAAIFGFAHGGMGTSESPLIARLFGLSSHGLIFGVAGLGFTFGASAGPFLTGYMFDLTGDYQVAFLVCAVFGIAGLISTAVLRPTKRLGVSL